MRKKNNVITRHCNGIQTAQIPSLWRSPTVPLESTENLRWGTPWAVFCRLQNGVPLRPIAL